MRKSTCLFPGLALHQYRLPVDADLVWRDQHVINWEESQHGTQLALTGGLQQLIDYPQVLGIDQASQDSTSGNPRKKKVQ